MTLQDWFRAHPRSVTKFARTIGITRSAVHKIARGASFPRPKTIQLIEWATEGQVTATDLMESYQMVNSNG